VRISQKRLELLEEREYKNKRHLVDDARDGSEKSAKKHKSDCMWDTIHTVRCRVFMQRALSLEDI
jgi:hypothetical protein